MTPDGSGYVRIVTVCTGNICRSPAGALLLADLLGPGALVQSAGTGAVVGADIHPLMRALLEAHGISVPSFQAQALTESFLRDADLVLTMTRAHRATVVELWPGAVRRTFTLREMAGLLDIVDPACSRGERRVADWLPSLLPVAAAARPRLRLGPHAMDISDPYGHAESAFSVAFEQIEHACDVIVGRQR